MVYHAMVRHPTKGLSVMILTGMRHEAHARQEAQAELVDGECLVRVVREERATPATTRRHEA